MRRLASLFLLLACQKPAAPPPPSVVTVVGHVGIDAAAKPEVTRGPLFVSWLGEAEKTAFDEGNISPTIFRDLLEHGVVADVDAAENATFTLPAVPGRIALVAMLDADHLGLKVIRGGSKRTLVGGTPAFESNGPAPPILLASHPAPEKPEACQGERITLEHIDAPEVAGKVGNDTSRRTCVRVPTSYADHPERRYPVIYGLPGLMSNDAAIITSYPLDVAETITVGVDTSTKTGSTYLVDSPTSGNWDTFMTKNLIPYFDAHYRTLPHREARATVGHSTGGFNAVSYAMRHPDLIGVIGSSSPDGLDLPVWFGSGPVKPWIIGSARVERGLGRAGQMMSYGVDWAPSSSPPGYDWFLDDNGKLVDAVIARWLAQSPTTWIRDPKRVEAIRPFSGHIFLAVGDTDEYDLYPPTVAFSKTLTDAGIKNELLVTHGGHGIANRTEQIEAIAKFFATQLEAAK